MPTIISQMNNLNEYHVRRKLYRLIGVLILAVALLWLGFESSWEPILIEYLSMSEGGRHVVSFVPYAPILLIAVAGYFMIKSREKPLRSSKDQVQSGKF